jgi:uncharacterized damage-inducible protein DinB
LFDENAVLLEQTANLLDGLSPQIYKHVHAHGLGGSVGGHTRHCVEFYQVFLTGLLSGRIDYDARSRDLLIETDVDHAINALRETAAKLRQVSAGHSLLTRLQVIENQTLSELEWSDSSVGRELRFLSSHTIHHCALIAILLRLSGHPMPESFGVAPSTLRYRAAQIKPDTCAA